MLAAKALKLNFENSEYKEVMKARLRKEGRRLDLTAPFGEQQPVLGVLFTVSR